MRPLRPLYRSDGRDKGAAGGEISYGRSGPSPPGLPAARCRSCRAPAPGYPSAPKTRARTANYKCNPRPQNLMHTPSHHSGLTGGAAATSGPGWCRRGTSLFRWVREPAARGERPRRAITGTVPKTGNPGTVIVSYFCYLRGAYRLGVRSFMTTASQAALRHARTSGTVCIGNACC